jgi:hypothetical protein
MINKTEIKTENKIENNKDYASNQNDTIEFENKISGINFIGNYKVLEASWTQGLKLAVKDLLMHSSDLQVISFFYVYVYVCMYVYICWTQGLKLAVKDLLMHSSDLQVKPIVGNKAIEIIEKVVFKPATLPFPLLSIEDLGRLSQSELEAHLTLVYKALHRHAVLSSPPTATASASPVCMYRCMYVYLHMHVFMYMCMYLYM